MSEREVLAVIPARGGSKGIPHKNIVPLCGKPLIAWTIEAARAAKSVTRVVVSTDDDRIADTARRFGAEVVTRPAEISGDLAPSEAALLHALDTLRDAEAYQPDLLVFLQCTAPLTTADDIDATVDILIHQEADSALAAVPFHYFLWRTDQAGNAVGVNHDKSRRLMRQEREPEYLEAGAVYVMRVPGFREARHRFFGKTALHAMPGSHRLEIDEPADLDRAAALLELQRADRDAAQLPDPVRALILDFDGVFTDNRVVVSEDGREAVACNRSDGMGLRRVREAGVAVFVLSTETNTVVKTRCDKLGLECVHAVEDKIAVLTRWLEERGVPASQAVYLGNDVNDVECMKAVGCGIAVADARPEARQAAALILPTRGGHGAVRDVCDMILERLR